LFQEEIKRRLNSGNACYHSVQNLLSSRLLSKSFKIRIYKTIMLPVVLYGCETWSLILREEHRLRVLENRVLRRILGPKRDEMMGGWRKLHNEELHDLYSSPNIRVIRIMKWRRLKWAGMWCKWGRRGKSAGKRPLRRHRLRWLDNIKMDLVEVGFSELDWVGLAQNRYRLRALVNAVMNLRVP
jgi:hypothetical protein